MNTYNVTLAATYTVNAEDRDEAIQKAWNRVEIHDLDIGNSDVKQLEYYDPEYDD